MHLQRAFFVGEPAVDVAGNRHQTHRSYDMADQLIIFDTTLRDGEQSPGASMTKD